MDWINHTNAFKWNKRFTDIEMAIPNISARMLTERLKELEHHGIITRHVFPETPVKIEYELTDKGHDLEKAMKEIQSGQRNGINS